MSASVDFRELDIWIDGEEIVWTSIIFDRENDTVVIETEDGRSFSRPVDDLNALIP